MAYRTGHVQGTKRERRAKETPWYAQLEEERIQHVEAAWQAEQTQQAQHPRKEDA